MNCISVILEVLNAFAAMANIAGFILERWGKHKRQRMTEGDIGKTGGNRS